MKVFNVGAMNVGEWWFINFLLILTKFSVKINIT